MASNRQRDMRRVPEIVDGRPRWVFQITRASFGGRKVEQEFIGSRRDAMDLFASGAKGSKAPRRFTKVKP